MKPYVYKSWENVLPLLRLSKLYTFISLELYWFKNVNIKILNFLK